MIEEQDTSSEIILQEKSSDLITRIQGLVKVVSNESYIHVCELRRAATVMKSEVWDWWTKNKVEPAHRLHKQLVSDRAAMVKPMDEAILVCDSLAVPWEKEQERIRREREAKAAEALRLQLEAQALSDAAELHAMGETDKAEQVLMDAVNAAPPPVSIPSSVPKIEGRSMRELWGFKITAPDLIPRDFLIPDTVKIGAVVRAMKGRTKIPGVEVFTTSSVTQRR